MADFNPIRLWKRFLALPNDDLGKTLIFAFLVTSVASVIVSVAAVTLTPFYQQNLDRERQARMEEMVASLSVMSDILSELKIDDFDVRIVDLTSGTFAKDIDPTSYNQREAARDPNQSLSLPRESDIAGIRQRANFAPVYILRRDQALEMIVFPVRGVGYQSMLYAFLAIEADANTIAGLSFYEQGETPGVGARITEPDWQALWPGKTLADENGDIQISVVRGRAQGLYEVDGISGATRTGNGVSNMLHFWLGDFGFGPFLKRIQAGEIRL